MSTVWLGSLEVGRLIVRKLGPPVIAPAKGWSPASHPIIHRKAGWAFGGSKNLAKQSPIKKKTGARGAPVFLKLYYFSIYG